MPKFLSTLSMIAVLAMSQGAFAEQTAEAAESTQEAEEATAAGAQEESTEATAGAATEEEAPSTEDLNMGEQVVPQAYVREEHGDWKLQCFKVDSGEEPCQLYQLLQDGQGNDVAEIALFRLPEGSKAIAGATVTVPLETLLTGQLTISVDGGKGKRYPFSFCSPVGCYARIGLTKGDIAAFKKGAKAVVSLVPAPAPDQRVKLDMSLKGFTAGFNATTVGLN
ncbi:MAG: invasion-associated locus B family protein [Rhodobacterales bacterium]|nr:MAG: invasion-associated locus B family protein [Rhodobacterales bacterium]